MSDYKNLNLDRETLDKNIHSFMESHDYTLDGGIQSLDKRAATGRATAPPVP